MKKFGMRNHEIGELRQSPYWHWFLSFGFAGTASAMLTARANHDHITIDFFYHGSTVSVRGESDPGVDLVIKITAPEGHQTLKQKGKVGRHALDERGDPEVRACPELLRGLQHEKAWKIS